MKWTFVSRYSESKHRKTSLKVKRVDVLQSFHQDVQMEGSRSECYDSEPLQKHLTAKSPGDDNFLSVQEVRTEETSRRWTLGWK